MKNALAVIGRFFLTFCCAEIAAVLALEAKPFITAIAGGIPLNASFWSAYAIEALPLAAAVAVFSAGFTASRRLRNRFSGYLLLFLMAFSVLGGGVFLPRDRPIPPEPFSGSSAASPSPPVSALPYFVGETSGTEAKNIVYVREPDAMPRLAWTDSGTLLPEQGLLLADTTAFSYPYTKLQGLSPPILGFSELRAWYYSLGGDSPVILLAAAAGAAALFCGLWPITRLFRWPLMGAFASGAALMLTGALHKALYSPSVGETAALIGLRLPASLVSAILCGVCGLALALLDFALAPPLRGSSSGRRRGRI